MFNPFKKKPQPENSAHKQFYGAGLDDAPDMPLQEEPTQKVDSLSKSDDTANFVDRKSEELGMNEASDSETLIQPDAPAAPKVQTPAKALPLPESLEQTINLLPEEVIMKRIWPRKGVNRWLVKFHNDGAEYYDVTLEAALTRLFKNQKLAAKRFAANRAAAEADE